MIQGVTSVARLEGTSTREVVRWTVESFHPAVALACSFSAEDVVLIDFLSQVIDEPRVFTLDTGRLAEETCDVMNRIQARYGIQIQVFFPRPEAVRELVGEHGPNPFYRSVELRKKCCHMRKVEPLGRALKGLKAWMTGRRREQSPARSGVKTIEIDEQHGSLIRVNPLAEWSWTDVWTYIRRHDLPYNELYDRGYESIGCAPCTRPVRPGEHRRAGRWWWESKNSKECGLHMNDE